MAQWVCVKQKFKYVQEMRSGTKCMVAYRSMLQAAKAAAKARKLDGKPATAAALGLLVAGGAASAFAVAVASLMLLSDSLIDFVFELYEEGSEGLYKEVLFSKRMCGATLAYVVVELLVSLSLLLQ